MTVTVNEYHVPAMVRECLDSLKIRPQGIYLDATFGSGGHSLEILKKLDKGKLIAFDQDADASENFIDDPRFILVNHNFIYLKNFLDHLGINKVDGIIADLGVSSHQFDTAKRGFSYRFDAPLDMRMDTDEIKTAAGVLNKYSEKNLTEVFRNYGEVKNAAFLARKIIEFRNSKPIESSYELNELISKSLRRGEDFHKYAAQVYQSLRIEVNNEIGNLKKLLILSSEVLKKGGRLVIISYHSLEDRLVKEYFRTGNFEGVLKKDIYGIAELPFTLLSRKAIVADDIERTLNTRIRSARLRVAEKI
jgi:16S rRNA (cytosine1402-N4)-methyltransferase